MATEFEVTLWGENETNLLSWGELALDEIQKLEVQLSFYREESDISDINRRAYYEPVTLDPRLFYLLERAKAIHTLSKGAFDITITPLLRAWGFTGGSGKRPQPEEVETARNRCGMEFLALNESDYTVRFLREGMLLDLGAIGKGYAIERVVEMLQELGVSGGMIHGGTSTVHAIGSQSDGAPWNIAIQNPHLNLAREHLTAVSLRDNSLSVSAIHGKYFTEDDSRYGHVINPSTGEPVRNALLAAVVSPSATDSDALSTALLVAGEPFFTVLSMLPDTSALLMKEDYDGKIQVLSNLK
jgi:thiamine biosynthesis lipoprotein